MVNALARHGNGPSRGILRTRHGRFSRIVCCGLLLQAAVAFAQTEGWAQEPTTFAGVPFDSSKAEALAKVRPGGCVAPPWEEMCSTLDLGLTVPLHLRWSFERDKFAGVVSQNFSSRLGDFEKLRAILIEQYGQPTSTEVQIVQNGAGAKFQNEILKWRGKAVAIMLMKYLGTLDHGVFSLSLLISPEEEAERQKKEDEARKKAAEKLK